MKVNSIIMLIESPNHSPKPRAFISHPHTSLLSVCSKEATLLSIVNPLSYHNIQQLPKNLREKERPHS